MVGKYYPKELKEEVINKIKSEGLTGVEASSRHGFNPSQGLIPRRLRRYAFIIDA